jgi:uncharacterized protein involved in outer membrane biogenesis
MTRRRRWILVPLAALGAGLIVFVVLFGWNWLKGPIEGLASAALERRFEVADLDVDLSTAPVVTLDRVRIANADWGSRPDMLSVAQVRFAIELSPLLRGDIRLPFLRVQEPDLLLETNREGLANWSSASRTGRRHRRRSRSSATSRSRARWFAIERRTVRTTSWPLWGRSRARSAKAAPGCS